MKNKDLEFDRDTQIIEAFFEDNAITVRVSDRPENFDDYSYIRTEYGLTRITHENMALYNAPGETT